MMQLASADGPDAWSCRPISKLHAAIAAQAGITEFSLVFHRRCLRKERSDFPHAGKGSRHLPRRPASG